MATIYVDPTVAGTGTGTLNDPFKSWASVTWTAGNTYLQKGGTTSTVAITVTTGGSSEATRIVVGSYDGATGSRTSGGINRARVNGAGMRFPLRTNGGVNYVTFDNIEVFGTDGGGTQTCRACMLGSSAITPPGTMSSNCVVSNCWLRDVKDPVPGQDSNGVQFFGDNNQFLNNLIEDISCDGIWGQGSNSVFIGNTIRRVSRGTTRGDCIQLLGDGTVRNDNAYIAYNYLDHSDVESKQCVISGDATYSSGAVIEFNTCVMRPYEGSIQTTCIMAEGPNSVVRNNVCIGGFMGIYLTKGGGVATGNIVVGNTIGIQQAPTGAAGGLVAHNACFNSTYLGIMADSDATFRAYNNILVGCVNGIGLAGSEDGNAFYQCDTNKIARVGSPTYGSRTVTSDPQFLDRTRPWLGLKPGSPCQSAGTYIQGARDRFGRRYLTPPNIGPWAVIGR